MTFDLGPFHFYRVEHSGTLDISLKCMEGWACGWEWGWPDDNRAPDRPVVAIRIGKLMILYLELFNGGCEVWLVGFWAFPKWRKEK